MMISTKGKYALRVMIDLAQNQGENYISLRDISERQQISLKYLEIIVSSLSKAGLLESRRGKTGGYKLKKEANQFSVYEIINATEENLQPVVCDALEGFCALEEQCLTKNLWYNLDQKIADYLKSFTLADVLAGKVD